MLRYQRSGIICVRVAKRPCVTRCGLQRSRHWSLLCASRKSSCSQQGALGLLPECQQVAWSLRGHERSWALSGAPHTVAMAELPWA